MKTKKKTEKKPWQVIYREKNHTYKYLYGDACKKKKNQAKFTES